jgi:hypothetical protein
MILNLNFICFRYQQQQQQKQIIIITKLLNELINYQFSILAIKKINTFIL